MAKKRESEKARAVASKLPVPPWKQTGLPRRQNPGPRIPIVVTRRGWPNNQDDENREALQTVINEIDWLWSKLSRLELALDDVNFFDGAEYQIEVDGEPSEVCPSNGDGRIAVANFRHLRESLCAELRRKCVRESGRDDLVHDVREMLDEYLRGDVDAIHILRFDRDNERAIQELQRHRVEAVGIVRVEMTKLLLWLYGKEQAAFEGGGRSTAQANVSIPDEYLKEARKLYRQSSRTPKKTVMERLGVGSNMATRIIEAMRKEGLCDTKPRGPHAKN